MFITRHNPRQEVNVKDCRWCLQLVTHMMDTDIFDRLFQLNEEDLDGVRTEINSHIAACRACVLEFPPNYQEALEQADQAYAISLAENLHHLEPMINFYRAHCSQGLRNWDKAFGIYTSGTLRTVNCSRLRILSRNPDCLDEMKVAEAKDSKQLRRVYANEDLHQRFSCHQSRPKRKHVGFSTHSLQLPTR